MKNQELIIATKQFKAVKSSIENLERKIFLGHGNREMMEEELLAKYDVKQKLMDFIIQY